MRLNESIFDGFRHSVFPLGCTVAQSVSNPILGLFHVIESMGFVIRAGQAQRPTC